MHGRTVWIGLISATTVLASLPAAHAEEPRVPAADGRADAEALVRRLGNAQALDEPGETDRVGQIAAEAMAAHPEEPRWRLAWVLAEAYAGRSKDVLADAEELVKLLPQEPGAHYTLGLCLVSTINDVAVWNRGARADRARGLWETALELDPAHVGARFSLIQFYRNAPGIAGGSKKKAAALARAGLEHRIGAHVWHAELGELAGEDGDWEAFNTEFASAIALAPTDRARQTIALSQALTLLRTKNDPAAALAVAQPLADASTESLPNFICARALRELDRCAEAIPYYLRVLERQPEAENSAYELGVCLAATGDAPAARDQLERFLKDHPKSDRAKDARKLLKSLR